MKLIIWLMYALVLVSALVLAWLPWILLVMWFFGILHWSIYPLLVFMVVSIIITDVTESSWRVKQ